MTDRKIENIVSELDKNNEKDEAFFGFYQYGGDKDESCIRANKQGLELFSAELLKARLEIEQRNFENGEIVFQMNMISFKFKKALMESHFNEKYVESEKYPDRKKSLSHQIVL